MSNSSGGLPGLSVLMMSLVSAQTKRSTAILIFIFRPRCRMLVISWRSFVGGIFTMRPLYVDDVHVHGRAKQAAQRGLKTELANFEQRLDADFATDSDPWPRKSSALCRPHEGHPRSTREVRPVPPGF